MILLTAMPASRMPGAVPTVPVVRAAAHLLRDRGERVRVLVPAVESSGWPDDVVLHIGAVTDPSAFAAAAAGVERVFLAGLVGTPLTGLRELTEALVRNRVRRVVTLDSHGSDFDDGVSEETWQWAAFDQTLHRHQIGRVSLRPTAVMAHAVTGGYPIPGSAVVAAIREGREVAEYLPDAPYAFIHEDDLAEIAANLLFDDRVHGTVDVSGTTVTATGRLTELGAALDTEVAMIELTAEQAVHRWRAEGWPADTIAVTLYTTAAFAAHPDNPALREQEETARKLLGREPRSFREWASTLR
ncbi:hypothetical protein [Nocardia sp. NPDC019395]|uniref:hypothetical protein n=1 Tax=Nocardia sp. NPDC019395 TaxID=3154686 RepID=UPI0033D194F1